MTSTFLSYNIASSSSLSGISQLINTFEPLIIFLQEVTINTEQLLAQVNGSFNGLSNIDPEDARKPGTAVLWNKELGVTVENLVPLRAQLITCLEFGSFVNIYAPTGSQGEKGRRNLFLNDLLPLIASSKIKPILVGDWNSTIRKEDTEDWNVSGSYSNISIHLQSLIKEFSYIDGFLFKDPNRV